MKPNVFVKKGAGGNPAPTTNKKNKKNTVKIHERGFFTGAKIVIKSIEKKFFLLRNYQKVYNFIIKTN